MTMKTSRRTLLISLGALYTTPAFSQAREAKPVMGANGAVATSQPLATSAALHILKSGGSAVDAAIAAAAMLGLTEPMMSGPGGDLFAQIHDPDGGLLALASAGRSGRGVTLAEMQDLSDGRMPRHGVHSVTVPGAVAGWFALHEQFGRLAFADLMRPAIETARRGFPVGVQTATDWSSADWINRAAKGVSGAFAEFDRVFRLQGETPKPGALFRNPDYANTLESIATSGPGAVYEDGQVAQAIMAALGEDSAISADDLAAHRPRWVSPLAMGYRDVVCTQLPPPGQGVSMLQMLGLLDRFDLQRYRASDPERLHILMEVTKIAYADRAQSIAEGSGEALIDPAHLDTQARRLSDVLAAPSSPPSIPLEEGDTSYLAVADAHGQMVSLITSVSGPFGSAIVPEGAGFCLQNRGAGFSLQTGHANAYAPAKTPFHTIIPGFVFRDEKPWLAFGVMGGAMQPQGQVQVLSNMVDHGMHLQAAGDHPRLRLYGGPQPDGPAEASPALWRVEHGFPASTVERLRSLGHQIEMGTPNPYVRYGGYQAVEAIAGGWAAATEIRQDGVALTY